MMKKEEYILLYEKCAAGLGTEQDRKLLEQYQDAFSLEELPWDEASLGNQQQVTERMFSRLQHSMQAKRRPRYPYRFAAAAAVLAVAVFCAVLYYRANSPAKPPVVAAWQPVKQDIAPGRKKAVLTLTDGRQIILDHSRQGVLASQHQAIIRKAKEGQLVYDLSKGAAPAPPSQALAYNVISTPRGGEYQLVLPDGTKVWLNAGSSLRFPAVFGGRERKVMLAGEAYFEVAKNKDKPFRVLAGGTEVEVLGTHFNVDAYAGHAGVSTTLLEGAVRLKQGDREVLLRPGQAGQAVAHGGFSVRQADVEAAVAWKNGYFVFQDENIHSIMEKVARWYDVTVAYRGNMTGKRFWGKVSRQESLPDLLKNLELTGDIHFKIESRPGASGRTERRVTVMP